MTTDPAFEAEERLRVLVQPVIEAAETYAKWRATAPYPKDKIAIEHAALLACARAQTEVLALARQLVDRQAEDEGLWSAAQTAPEAYLQRALRTLHARVERMSAAAEAVVAELEGEG